MGEDNLYNNKKFLKLKAKWDKKLVDSGIEEIEHADGSLKASTHPRTIKNALKEKEEREIYYNIASEFLETHAFDVPVKRDIWGLHCEGHGKLAIAKALKITPYKVEITLLECQKLARLRRK